MTKKLMIALASLVLVASGCGSDDDGASVSVGDETTLPADAASSDEAPGEEAEADDQPEAGESPAGSSSEPCDIDTTPVTDRFDGVDLGEGRPGTGEGGVQDVEWTSRNCNWESPTVELRVAIAGADDFAEGFVCAESIGTWGEVETIDDIGDQGWYEWDDFQGGTGRFGGCTGELRVDITVGGPRDGTPITEEAAREATLALARTLL